MVNPITRGAGSGAAPLAPREKAQTPAPPPPGRDRLDLGRTPVNAGQAQNIVLERAYEKLRGIVGDARTALGIPEGAVIDTSPEATANRIADFALGFFGKYAKNNGLGNDEAGRKQFADFIGAAIAQGIDEARGILTALNVLNGEIAGNVDRTAGLVQERLDAFVKNGL